MKTFDIFNSYLEILHDIYSNRATSKQYKGKIKTIGGLGGSTVVGIKFSSREVKFEASDRVLMEEKSAIVEYYKNGMYFFRLDSLGDFFEGMEVNVVSSADLLFLVENMLKVLKMVYSNEDYKDYADLIDGLYMNKQNLDWVVTKKSSQHSSGLTESQNELISTVLDMLTKEKGLIPVEGPGGTGKTECIVEIAKKCIKMNKRVLICSPTNLAVDNVLSKLVNEKKVLRIGSESSIARSEVRKFSIRNVLKEDQKVDDLIKESLIVGSTLDSSGIHLRKEKFDLVVIDEASAVELPKLLLAFIKSKRIMICGDTKQLSQFMEYEVEKVLAETISGENIKKLELSPFELISKLWADSKDTIYLKDNFRNPRRIFDFINSNYYENRMVSRVQSNFTKSKPTNLSTIANSDELVWIIPHMSVLEDENRGIFNTVKLKQRYRTSYYNYGNLIISVLMLKELLKKYRANEIGIITPFTAQVSLIREFLVKYPEYILGKECKDDLERTKLGFFLISNLNINTINKFQGQERDVIIFDITSNADFIFNDEKKLNVVLGRAKKQAIFIGAPPRHPKFQELTEYAKIFGEVDFADYSLMFLVKDSDIAEFNKIKDLLELIKDSDFSPKDPEIYLKKELLASIMSRPAIKKDASDLGILRKVSDIVSETLREFFSSELIDEEVYNNLEFEIEQKIKELIKREKMSRLFEF